MLRSLDWKLGTDISEHPIRPISRVKFDR